MKERSQIKWTGPKIFLSLIIVFHLVAIIVLANSGSYLGRSFQGALLPYGNSLGINSTWNFFSPDPAHIMYLHYRVSFNDLGVEEDGKAPIEGFIPPDKQNIEIDSSKRRFLYAMRFLLLDQSRLHRLLGPYLCRQHPGAKVVYMEQIWEAILPLDRAIVTGQNFAPEGTQLFNATYYCERENDEVSQ